MQGRGRDRLRGHARARLLRDGGIPRRPARGRGRDRAAAPPPHQARGDDRAGRDARHDPRRGHADRPAARGLAHAGGTGQGAAGQRHDAVPDAPEVRTGRAARKPALALAGVPLCAAHVDGGGAGAVDHQPPAVRIAQLLDPADHHRHPEAQLQHDQAALQRPRDRHADRLRGGGGDPESGGRAIDTAGRAVPGAGGQCRIRDHQVPLYRDRGLHPGAHPDQPADAGQPDGGGRAAGRYGDRRHHRLAVQLCAAELGIPRHPQAGGGRAAGQPPLYRRHARPAAA
ncbi:hypothetical protein D3C72_1438450 [compost metagenome]